MVDETLHGILTILLFKLTILSSQSMVKVEKGKCCYEFDDYCRARQHISNGIHFEFEILIMGQLTFNKGYLLQSSSHLNEDIESDKYPNPKNFSF